MSDVGCVILAAGKGTRFKSDIPKVLHELHGRPILQNLLDIARSVGFSKPVVVIGHKAGEVERFLKGKATAVIQKRQLGTGDAVKVAKHNLSRFKDILVLYGDTPLIKPETLRSLIRQHKKSGSSCTVLTARMEDPSGYGRVVRGASGEVISIVEEKEASAQDRRIREINVGAYCFKSSDLFSAIERIKRSSIKKEYYLTDLIEILLDEGKRVDAVLTDDANEALGINSRAELAKSFSILNKRTIDKLTKGSVTVLDPATTFISPDAKIGKDTAILPFVVIENNVRIGRRCLIGPFCRLRPGTVLGDGVEIGNFVELVRTRVKSGTKAKHLTYLGDAVVGKDVNVGCGTITANYDGKGKYRTTIDDEVFVGSGTILVAPVKIGRGAVTGAGAVVLKRKNVPPKAVAVGVPAKILSKSKR